VLGSSLDCRGGKSKTTHVTIETRERENWRRQGAREEGRKGGREGERECVRGGEGGVRAKMSGGRTEETERREMRRRGVKEEKER